MNGRLGYVDALRGFSMLLVVFAHVMLAAGVGDTKTVLGTALISFRMPLFFFISGYFAFREREAFTPRKIRLILRRKTCAQIIGMLTFLSIYCYCHSLPVFTDKGWGFGGYWFTVSLFQMYLLYLAVALTAATRGIVMMTIVSAAVAACIIIFRWKFTSPAEEYLFTGNTLAYLPYFCLGLLAHAFRGKFVRLLGSQWFITAAIVLFVLCLMLVYDRGMLENAPVAYRISRRIILRLAGLAAVTALFYSLRERLGSENPCARALRYTGRRTLDIYYLHYLFIPLLPQLAPLLRQPGKTIIIILILGTVTAALTAFCLLLSRWIRTSVPLSRLLFGEK